jgi:hypothetical protein
MDKLWRMDKKDRLVQQKALGLVVQASAREFIIRLLADTTPQHF